MANVIQTNSNTQQGEDLNPISNQSEIDQINRELGLIIPDGVLTESISLWHQFFFIIRNMLDAGSISEDQVKGLLSAFESIPDAQKIERMNLLSAQYNTFKKENQIIKDLWMVDEMSEEYDRFMSLLPVDVQDRFNIYLQTGEDVGDIKELIQAKLEMESSEVQSRLQSAINRRLGGFRVDSGDDKETYELRKRNGVVLEEGDLEERFATNQYDQDDNYINSSPQLEVLKQQQLASVTRQPTPPGYSDRVITAPRATSSENQPDISQQANQSATDINENAAHLSQLRRSQETTISSNNSRIAMPGVKPKPMGTLDDLLNQK